MSKQTHGEPGGYVRDSRVGDGTTIAPYSTVVDCQLGSGCQIWRYVNLYGCEIGDESMVGADAVVTDDVPANAIVAGNPTEIVGSRN